MQLPVLALDACTLGGRAHLYTLEESMRFSLEFFPCGEIHAELNDGTLPQYLNTHIKAIYYVKGKVFI